MKTFLSTQLWGPIYLHVGNTNIGYELSFIATYKHILFKELGAKGTCRKRSS